MLTDPFYIGKPPYGDNYTGLQYFDSETGTVATDLLTAIKSVLEQAGWTEVLSERKQSEADTQQIAVMMPVALPPTEPSPPPVEMIDACTRLIFPQWIQATVGKFYFIGYNPYIHQEPEACDDGRRYFAIGPRVDESAYNLGEGITDLVF